MIKGDLEHLKYAIQNLVDNAIKYTFHGFVRAEHVRREIKGSSVGLHIAKSAVASHGGKFLVESEGKRKGFVFYVRLPNGH